jgi:AcrR family transcriptional regulator
MPRVSQDHLDSRRRQILDAARRCFLRNGFHATSMQDVLREANLSAGAVYRYFDSKDDIIAAIATAAMGDIASAFAAVTQDDPPPLHDVFAQVLGRAEELDNEQSVARMVIQVWGEALRSPALGAVLANGIREVLKSVTTLVELYQERGDIKADAPAESVARVLISVLPGYLVQRAILADADASMFLDGLDALLPGQKLPG